MDDDYRTYKNIATGEVVAAKESRSREVYFITYADGHTCEMGSAQFKLLFRAT